MSGQRVYPTPNAQTGMYRAALQGHSQTGPPPVAASGPPSQNYAGGTETQNASNRVPVMTNQMGRMNIGPPPMVGQQPHHQYPTQTVPIHSRYPGVGQSMGIPPAPPPTGQHPLPPGGQSNHPPPTGLSGHQILPPTRQSSLPSNYPSSGLTPSQPSSVSSSTAQGLNSYPSAGQPPGPGPRPGPPRSHPPPTGQPDSQYYTRPPTGSQASYPPPPPAQSGQPPPPPPGQVTGSGSGMVGPPPPQDGGLVRPPSPHGMTEPPPHSGGVAGLPPMHNVRLIGPPPGGVTGPPPPQSSSMTGPSPQGMGVVGPPPGGVTGPPPPQSSSMTGPLPQGMGVVGPPPQSGGLSGHLLPQGGSSMTGPPPSSVGPPPTRTSSQPSMSAPLGQRYPRSMSSGAPNPQQGPAAGVQSLPGQPMSQSQTSFPPSGGVLMQKQLQLPELQPVNLLENRHILPSEPLQHPVPSLPGHLSNYIPDPSVFCSSMNTVPATSGLLNKLKLPFAVHIHPFKDSKAKSCPVINPSVIVRCRVCRAYINPYVSFTDSRHWRCNLCFRTNVVPEDYDFNPHSGKRGDRTHHTELKHSSVEYIAPSEYLVRPPQPSVYMFLIDVSYPAVESGLLGVFCRTLLECLSRLPGDGRTMVGFLTYDQHLHFYNLKSSQAQPQMLVMSDLNDVFIPSPTTLLVNLRESKELVKNLLEDLPKMFANQRGPDSALGAALQVSEKLLHNIGGRITVFQSSLPNTGPGALKIKEQSQSSLKKDQLNMGASSDFYKKLALDCSAQQIAVDLFVFSSPKSFVDLTTLSSVAKFSSGQISYYPNFHHTKAEITKCVEKDFRRYLTRNIGFEAVMRVRCTEGLSLHTFHGNFFVRSTDLLSLPNVNPDHGFCMNIAIDESLKDYSTVCFQSALLYTTYRGERRIRVHTLCLPVSEQLAQIYAGINVQGTIGVLAKMAVDRMSNATLGDAREALLNTVQDATKAYRSNLGSSQQSSQFSLPSSLKLLPLFVLSLLKHPSLTLNPNVFLDERAQAVNLVLTLPLSYLLPNIYPRLYALHTLSEKDVIDRDGEDIVSPPVMQLSAERISRQGIFLMDYGKGFYIWASRDSPTDVVKQLLGVLHFGAIAEFTSEIPVQDNSLSKLANHLIKQIEQSRQHYMPLLVIREDGSQRRYFINRLLEDKTEDGTSYYELLSHVARQINK